MSFIIMEKRYFSLDVEATGPYPWNSSMLSFGACLADDVSKTFYRELHPIYDHYLLENFKIGASQLECLGDYDHDNFNPEEVLKLLETEGVSPYLAMKEFSDWINEHSKGYKPVLLADPIKFDGMFISYYFDKFSHVEDPFSYGGEDTGSMIRGRQRKFYEETVPIKVNFPNYRKHHALDDAIYQALEFQKISK